jgi:lipopolysaccharide transport system permease protein
MGTSPHVLNWIGAILFVASATAVMAYVYTRYRSRIVYWA